MKKSTIDRKRCISNIIQQIKEELDGNSIEDNTEQVLTALYNVAINFDEHAYVCATIDKDNAHPEWLYDFSWCNYEDGRLDNQNHLNNRWNNKLNSLLMVAECEWGDKWDVIDDFEKLLIAGKGTLIRVMIYAANNVPANFEENLCSRVNAFEGTQKGDTYLLVVWKNEENNRNESRNWRYFKIIRTKRQHKLWYL